MVEAKKFVDSMVGKARMEHHQVVKMFELYNILYRSAEHDYDCEICVIRIYNDLRRLTKDVVIDDKNT